MSRRRWTLAVLAGIALVLIVGRVAASVYVDYRWYAVMSAGPLWRLKALHTLALTGTSGAVSAAFVFLNLYAVRRSVVSLILPRRLANLEIGEEVPGHYLLGAVIALSVILGALLALPGEHWTTLALARYGRVFGETDPYFEADLGFFIYSLPLENTLYVWALIAALLVTAVVIFFYALTPSLRWEKGKLYMSNYVRRHMIVLGALLLMLLSWSYRLDAYDVLLSGSGVEGTFSFSDHYATIRVSSWLWVITAGAAVVVLWLGWIGQVRAAGGVVVSLLLASILLRQAAPPIVRRLASSVDPATREQPYMAIRADYTRRAYGIERLATGNSSVIFASLGEAANALSIWDPAALERAVTRMRGSRGVAHSVGWAVSPSGLEAVLPLRSFRQDESGQSDSWTVTRVAAYAADEAGDPVLLGDSGGSTARALPPVLVFPAASGYRVVTNSPSDLGAAELTSWPSRLAHAWSLQNFRLLGGRPAREEAHLMTHRDLRARLQALVPFLSQGTTILPLLPDAGHGDDTLYWVVDLYATAGTYPLSHRVLLGSQEQSYIQHAATAIVNAHTGRVRLVADSILDPLAESWVRVLPDLFTDWPRVPAHISAGVPPAGDAARVQAFAVARYGLRGEATRGGHLAWPDGADSLLAHDAPPMLVFPQDGGSLGMTEPVLDSNDRAVGIIAAVGRGQSVNYWIPVSKKQPRWAAMIDRLDRSSDSASVSQRDLRIVHGKVRIVPLDSGLAFVRPAYHWRQEAPPLLASVRALVGDTLVSGRNLAIAIGLPPRGDTLPPLSTESFRVRVAAMYEEMRAALARGDLTGFAQAYKALGDLVARAEP